MISDKKRIEEDLEKIRSANLPHNTAGIASDDELKLEKWDIPAMILAVMSLVLPYIAAFAGIMAGVVFLLGLIF